MTTTERIRRTVERIAREEGGTMREGWSHRVEMPPTPATKDAGTTRRED